MKDTMLKFTCRLFAIFIIPAFFFQPLDLLATDWYVVADEDVSGCTNTSGKPDGNSGNTGIDWDNGFDLISTALAKTDTDDELVVKNGDTIYVASGTFTGPKIDYTGRAIKVISTDGPSETTLIRSGSGKVAHFQTQEYSISIFSGFTITGGDSDGAISIHNSSPTIENCIIDGNDCPGIFVDGPDSGFQYAIPRIRKCLIINNSGYGIQIESGGNPTLYNCVIADNDSYGIDSRGDAGFFGLNGQPSSFNAINCTIANNDDSYQIYVRANAETHATLSSCIIVGGGGERIYNYDAHWGIGALFPSPIVRYCAIDGSYDSGDGSNSNLSITMAEAEFIDASRNGADNYHLSMNSVVIDTGGAGLGDDMDYNLRPYSLSNGFDIGAYEFNFCYLVENDLFRVGKLPNDGSWNTDDGQWKNITAVVDSGSPDAVDSGVAPVSTGDSLQTFQTHFYKINFPVGQNYGMMRIKTQDGGSGPADTYGYLIDANECGSGASIAEDDNSGGNSNFEINYALTDGTKATYYFAVKSKNTEPYDLYLQLQTDDEGNMCDNPVVDSDNYKFNNTIFESPDSQVTVPAAFGTASIDFDDDIDVYKIEFAKPGTIDIKGFDSDFDVILKNENCEKIETDIIYETDRIIADIYDYAHVFLEIKTKEGVGSKEYNFTLDLYPPDFWYDVVTGVLPSEHWIEHGISTKGGLEYDAVTGTFVVEGNGAGLDDLTDTRDQAYYVYKEVAGDFEFSANIQAVNSTEVTSYEELAGLMLRDDLSQGAKNVFAGFTPGEIAGVQDGKFNFKYRDIKDTFGSIGKIDDNAFNSPTADDSRNIKIKREGYQYSTSYYDVNNTEWVEGVDYGITLEGVGNLIGSKAHVGLAVSSYNTTPDYMFIDDGPAASTNGGEPERLYFKCKQNHTGRIVNRPWIYQVNFDSYETYSFTNVAVFSTFSIPGSAEYIAEVNAYLVATNENRPRLYKKSGINYVGYESMRSFSSEAELIANLPRERFVRRDGLSSNEDPVYSYMCLKDNVGSDTTPENNKPQIFMVKWDAPGALNYCRMYRCLKANGPGTADGVQTPVYEGDNEYWAYAPDYEAYGGCNNSDDEGHFSEYSESENYGSIVQYDENDEPIWQVVGYNGIYSMWQNGELYGRNYLQYWNEISWDTNYEDLAGYYSVDLITPSSAEQSSTYNDCVAERSIDGNTNGDGELNISHTNNDNEAWLQVDLGALNDVYEITIYNRTDGSNTTRLDDFYIFVTKSKLLTTGGSNPDLTNLLNRSDSELWHSNMQDTFTDSKSFHVNNGQGYNGRYVIIRLSGSNYLHIAELQAKKYSENSNSAFIGNSWGVWRRIEIDSNWIDGDDETVPVYHTWNLDEKYGLFWQDYWGNVSGDLEVNGTKIKDLLSTRIWTDEREYETSQSVKATFKNVMLDTKDIELGEPGETGSITLRPAKLEKDLDILEFLITEAGKLTVQTSGCLPSVTSKISIYNQQGEQLNTVGEIPDGSGNYFIDKANVTGSTTPVDLIVPPGTYYLKVYSPDDDVFEYGIKVDCDTDAGDDHSDYSEFATILQKWPVDLSPRLYFERETGNITDSADKDYFRFDIPSYSDYPNGGYVRIMADHAATSAPVNARLLDSKGMEVASSDDIRIANPYFPTYRPLWSSQKVYEVNDKVSHGAFYYQCTAVTDVGEEPGEMPAKWTVLSMSSEFNVTWALSTTYYEKDVVQHNAVFYRCTAAFTTEEPSGSASDWSILADIPNVNSLMIEKKLNVGTYYIEMTAPATVNYELAVDFDDYGGAFTSAHPFGGFNTIKGHYETVKGTLSSEGYDADVFELIVPNNGMIFTIYTTGSSQTYGNLYSKTYGTHFGDSTSQEDGNFTFTTVKSNDSHPDEYTDGLPAGTYYIQTCMKDTSQIGDYVLHIDLKDDFINNWSRCPATGTDGSVSWACPVNDSQMGDLALNIGGVIEIPGDTDFFKYESANGRVTIESTGVLDTLASLFRYNASSGSAERVTWNNDGAGDQSGNFKIQYDVSDEVTYLLSVKSQFPQDTGSYGLSVTHVPEGGDYDEDDEGDNYKDAYLVIADGLSGTVTSADYLDAGIDLEGDYDYYKFDVTGKGLLKVWSKAPAGTEANDIVDLYGYLYAGVGIDANGNCSRYEFLMSNDDDPENTIVNDGNFAIQYYVDGEYAYSGTDDNVKTRFYVKVRAFQKLTTGKYELHLSFTDDFEDLPGSSCLTAISIGQDYLSPDLAIDMPGDKDYFRFVTGPVEIDGSLTAGSLTAITTTPSDSPLDLFGYLKNYMCSTVLLNDNGAASGNNFNLSWPQQAEIPEVFYVGVRDFEDKNMGSYTLNLTSNGTFIEFGKERFWKPVDENRHYFGFEIPETASTLELTCTGSDVETDFSLISVEDGVSTEVPFTIKMTQDNDFTITNPNIDPGIYFLLVNPTGLSVAGMNLKADSWNWTQSSFTNTANSGSGRFNYGDFERLPNSHVFEMEVTGNDTSSPEPNDIWGTTDKGYFAYRSVGGDFQISARVDLTGNPDEWVKAGVMVRDEIIGTSPNVFVAFASGHGCTSQNRLDEGDTVSVYDNDSDHKYVKIVRKEQVYTFYTSRNGDEWLKTDDDVILTAGDPLTGDVLVGFAASAHKVGTETVKFEEITFTNNPLEFE